MSLKPLDILKKGFAKLSRTVKDRRDELTTKLAWGETISPSNEDWLDNEGNTVDKKHILDLLESASDYERGVE
jgi:hypothetical protein